MVLVDEGEKVGIWRIENLRIGGKGEILEEGAQVNYEELKWLVEKQKRKGVTK